MARPKKQIRKKRADGTFEAKVTIGHDVHGKAIRKSFYSAKSFEDAKLKGQKYVIEHEMMISREEAVAKGTLTFAEVAKEVFELKENRLRETTYEVQEFILNKHILPFFGDWKIQSIRRMDVERYLMSKAELKNCTLKDHKNIIHSVFTHALQNGYIYVNPIENMTVNFGKPSADKKILTLEEADKLMRTCVEHPTWISVGIYLMIAYGISRSEVLGIKSEDVDKDNKLIRICRSVSDVRGGGVTINETKNKFRNRSVVVSQEAIDLIVNDPMFSEKEFIVSPFGKPHSPKNFTYHFQEFLKRHNISRITPHACRHTRASIMLVQGVPEIAICRQFGWSSTEMIMKHYGHINYDELRKMLGIE